MGDGRDGRGRAGCRPAAAASGGPAGDEAALERLYARHGPALLAYADGLLADRHRAEETVQDTLLAVWRGAGSFEYRSTVFGKVAWRVVEAVGRQLRLPELRLPQLDWPEPARAEDVRTVAAAARAEFGFDDGPVPHMVRLLEAHGVIVLSLPDASERVDAFSHWYGQRPFVFLNPAKNDKARSRMDAAHELGHLLLHHDAEPGSQLLEREATAFASEFLAPSTTLAGELPARLDFDRLHELKRRWGISLKALVYRGHDLGIYRDHTYRRGMSLLAQWGHPEPGDLGPREQPSLLGRAVDLLNQQHTTIEDLAAQAGLPATLARAVIDAATEHLPELRLTPTSS
ncbi:ImmA/IrrE family metallo-endopeptidase [Micromonospora fluostatini]|uniref:ImmA/IrrE family metallo-endopeptidase n=1 Tax=Micromonospora fluostatini TaxID=1629071 RepID=A0ABY2DJE6_9ACTN|nr:ImmA/IrrE family metallo-endopeptidase [Micromonospora fluostatini]